MGDVELGKLHFPNLGISFPIIELVVHELISKATQDGESKKFMRA